MVIAGVARQADFFVSVIVLGFAAAKSRQFSGLQNLTSPALMPPDLLQVPQAQYPKVAGLTHRAGAGVGTAVQTASTAAMYAGNKRFATFPSLGLHWRQV
jgi:hypothetical protein